MKLETRLERYSEAMELVDAGRARPEVVEAVELLRAGLDGVEIAERLGIARSTAYQRLSDPTDEKNQARKRKHHGTCRDCGGPTFNGGSVETPERCRPCRHAFDHEVSVAWLVAEVHHWHELYGEVPGAYCWNVANMRWQNLAYAEGRNSGRFSAHTIAEIERRHREDGPWPAQTSVTGTFGNWNALIAAAGFSPLTVGKKRNGRAV